MIEDLPHERLRRRLAAAGIPPERHGVRELQQMLPAELDGRPFDEMSADAVAEVLLYLVGKKVLSLPPSEPAGGGQRCEAPQPLASPMTRQDDRRLRDLRHAGDPER